MCNCEDRPCCGCGREETQDEAREAWEEANLDMDWNDTGVYEDDDTFEEDSGDSDDCDGGSAEDSFIDAEYESRYEADFDC